MAEGHRERPTLAQLINELEKLGCKITPMAPAVMGSNGPFTVRYVINPATKGYCTLPNEPLESRVSLVRLANIERLLGLKTRFTD